MTQSYPDQQRLLQRSNVSYVYEGHDTFCPINLGQSSQDSKNLSNAKQLKGIHPKWVSNYCLINLGQSSQEFRESLKDARTIKGVHPRRSEATSQSTWGIVLGL